jgi:glycosyltransferase involved in cell wall biosynthesis
MPGCTSVIMPVRNGAAFIAEAISSALAQLGEGDEVVVVDDGSIDSTRSVVVTIRDKRVRMLEGSGRGVSAARNVGLAAAKNEFVAFLDHDDLWPEGRHKIMLAALTDDTSIDAVFGRIRVRFDQGVRPSAKYLALDGTFVHGASVCTGLFCRRILARIGGFEENMRFGEDVDYHMRLFEADFKFELCEIDSLIYRRHLTNSTNDQEAALDGFSEMLRRKIARARERKAGSTS